MLKKLLQVNSNGLVFDQKQKQTNKQRKISAYMKIEFQNCCITGIKNAWMNPWIYWVWYFWVCSSSTFLLVYFCWISSSNRLSQPNWLWHNICLKISHCFSECVITTNWRWTSSKDVNIHVVNGSLWVVHWCDHSPTKESSVDSSVD